MLKEVLPAFKRQLHIRISPKELFADRSCKMAAPEKVFLMMSHDLPAIHIQSCDPLDIARRMSHSNEYEMGAFFEYYQAFRFAFPNLRNEFLENVYELQNSLLNQALAEKETYQVLHPYPVSLDELFAAMQPFCQKPVEVLV
jgi:hypothetical protein